MLRYEKGWLGCLEEARSELGRDFVHHPDAGSTTAEFGCAVEVALAVENYAGGRIGSVVSSEPVDHTVAPLSAGTGLHLKHHATSAFALTSAASCGSPKIAILIECQGTAGPRPVLGIGEIVQHGFAPTLVGACQLVDRAAAGTTAALATALYGRSVKSSRLIQHQAAVDEFAVVGGAG